MDSKIVAKENYLATLDEGTEEYNKVESELKEMKAEQEAYDTFALQCPVNVSPSVINRIAWHIEKHFQDEDLFSIEEYDIEKLKAPHVKYSTTLYNKIKALKDEYDNDYNLGYSR